MLYVDIPSHNEFAELNAYRDNACVSLYIETSPLTQKTDSSLIALHNAMKEAVAQLHDAGVDKKSIQAMEALAEDLRQDVPFWKYQAHSLAVFLTPSSIRTYRLATKVHPTVQVADRFHLSPLLRAMSFCQSAYVLAMSENAVRLVEVTADLPAVHVSVDNLPKDAASALGISTLNDRSPTGKIQGSEGHNVRMQQFARAIANALRPLLLGQSTPLILACSDRLAVQFRAVNTYPNILEPIISGSPDRLSEQELSEAARPILDAYYHEQIKHAFDVFEQRAKSGRATNDLSDAARAATFGAIHTLLVDLDDTTAGTIDEDSGAITFAERAGKDSYSIVDEIAGRAFASGARILAVRSEDLPHKSKIAAILRYAV
jgi:hypothetical protein